MPRKREPDQPPGYRVEIDWRGEVADYLEDARQVRVECIYWGGPNGSVSHIDGFWAYSDGRREPLTSEARAMVLQRVIEHARKVHDIQLEIERG